MKTITIIGSIALVALIILSVLILLGVIQIPGVAGDNGIPPGDNGDIKEYYFSTVGLPDESEDVCRGCYPNNQMWFAFRIPDNSIVTRVEGIIKIDLLGNSPCEVWFDIYNKCTGSYVDAVYVIPITEIRDGWISVDFDVEQEITTFWIGFAGCHYYDSTIPYNRVIEFKGTIYYKTDTDGCPILDMLASINPFKNIDPGSPNCNC